MLFNVMNINQLKGKILSDPELKETKNGKKLLTFNFMYFTRQSTHADGSHANFINVEAWQKTAELCAPLLQKGMEVIVNGAVVQKRWNDENGANKSMFIFSAEAISITDLKLAEQFLPETETEAA